MPRAVCKFRLLLACIIVLFFAPLVYAAAPDAVAIVAEADRIATAHALWPGYEPSKTPVAIYDGMRTLLFRHPHPPEGFHPLADHKDVFIYEGLFSAVRANTSTELGGVLTSTVMLDKESTLSVRGQAALLLHEMFHFFQRQQHKDWVANEGALFTYPLDDAQALALRRLETEALRRALAATEKDARCWAMLATTLRRERFARLPNDAAEYERQSELNEGLPSYIQLVAEGNDRPQVPADEFKAGDVRLRAYTSGPALAFLLDRFDAQWKARLNQQTRPLDQILRAALIPQPETGCGFSATEKDAATRRAASDVAGVRSEREATRAAFDAQPGWKLVVRSARQPLWPQGFDPWNVFRLDAGEVLHKRWVKLGNDSGTMEVMDHGSITTPAGAHPLFNGVKQVVVAGIPSRPEITRGADGIRVKAEFVTARFKAANVSESSRQIIVELP